MMRTAVGSFTGNGDQQFINLGFEPDVVITRTSSASYASGYWSRLSFVNRSHSLSNILGFPGGALAVENGFWVGNSNLFNEAGQTMYYIAFADAGENAFEQQDWMGDGFARNIALKNNKTPLAVIIKRDNARPAIFKSTLNALFTPMDGTATPTPSSSTLITAINQGSISLDGANEVNELFGSLGEGINGAFFFGGVNSTVINWTGDGLAGRVIQCGMATSGALIVRDGAASSPRIVTTAMAAGVNAPTKASALQSNEITVSGSTLVIGSTPGTLNNSGSSYTAIIFGTDTGTYARTPAVITRSKKVVSLPGRNIASYIDCGTSDATLKVTGAFSIEWMGSLKYQDQNAAAVGVDQMMLCRSIGIAENSGTPGAITTAGT